ncbi:MAG TPA: hypothetical protein VF093_02205 [Solirubrobacterales bacterium]
MLPSLIKPSDPSDEKTKRSKNRERLSWWDRLVDDWKPLWSGFRESVEGILKLFEESGRLAIQIGELIQGFHGFLRDHGSRLLILATAAGISSPIFDGWGSARVSSLPLGDWAPAVVLPATVLLVRVTLHAVAKESWRRAKRIERERPDSNIDSELTVQAELRGIANEKLFADGKDGRLDNEEFVHDIMAALYIGVVGSHSGDFVLALLRLEDAYLEAVSTRGRIDDELRSAIQLPWEDLIEFGFDRALQPLQYRCSPVPFSANAHSYVLLGLSGATIPGETTVQISRAATAMVSRLAYGDEAPGWMAGEQ